MGLFKLPKRKEESVHVVRGEEAIEKGIEPGLYRDGEPYDPSDDDVPSVDLRKLEKELKRKEKLARYEKKTARFEEKTKAVGRRMDARREIFEKKAGVRKAKNELKHAKRENLKQALQPILKPARAVREGIVSDDTVMNEVGQQSAFDMLSVGDEFFDFKSRGFELFGLGTRKEYEPRLVDLEARPGSKFTLGFGNSQKYDLSFGRNSSDFSNKKGSRQKNHRVTYLMPGGFKI